MRAEAIIRKRMTTMLSVLTLLFFLIGARIGGLAILEGKTLTARGVKQWTREGVVTAQRGAIEDRNGETLALSTTAYIASVNPQRVRDDAAFARLIAPLLGVDEAGVLAKLQKKGQNLQAA